MCHVISVVSRCWVRRIDFQATASLNFLGQVCSSWQAQMRNCVTSARLAWIMSPTCLSCIGSCHRPGWRCGYSIFFSKFISLAFIIYALTNMLLHAYSIGLTARPQTPDARNNYYQAVPEASSLFSGYTMGPRVLGDEEVYELNGTPDIDDDPFDDDRPRRDRET